MICRLPDVHRGSNRRVDRRGSSLGRRYYC